MPHVVREEIDVPHQLSEAFSQGKKEMNNADGCRDQETENELPESGRSEKEKCKSTSCSRIP